MTKPMYKDGIEMEVSDNLDSRKILIRQGWSEKDESKQDKPKRGRPAKKAE